jgi:prolyl-tRNA editing enzyme YbaK/EbsC (Cys-tRNA(Pro) deacylase)
MDDIERRVRNAVAPLPDVEVIDCDPALADTADFCAAYGYSMDDSANAILVAGRSEPPLYAVCVVLASTRLDVNRTVRKRLGVRKASFAPADVTADVTGMALGGVTPFALPRGLPLWIDRRVMERERVIVGGGSRSAKVVGPPKMLLAVDGAEVVDDLAAPPPG